MNTSDLYFVVNRQNWWDHSRQPNTVAKPNFCRVDPINCQNIVRSAEKLLKQFFGLATTNSVVVAVFVFIFLTVPLLFVVK